MRYLFGFLCVCALGLMGCGETTGAGGSGGSAGDGGAGGSAPIKSGLWLGGNPASNTDGTPFDTGWAICFHVNEDGTALTPSPDCVIDGLDDEVTLFEVSWKDDVGRDRFDEACGATGAGAEDNGNATDTVPIEDNAFEFSTHGAVRVVGSFEGDTATGTAMYADLGATCELVGGWTATPAETDCTGIDNNSNTECRSDRMVGVCWFDLCVTDECSGLEDGIYCVYGVLGDGWTGVCEAGECTKPEDCTGLADGVNCAGEDFGFCEGGECVAPP